MDPILIAKVITATSLPADIVICVILSCYLYKIISKLEGMNKDARKVAFINIFNRGKRTFVLYGIGAFVMAIFELLAFIFSSSYFAYSALSIFSIVPGGILLIVGTKHLLRIVELKR